MEKSIAKWYQSCGIYLANPEQYKQRVESIKNFTQKKVEVSIYGELVKCFMEMPYDSNMLSGFVKTFNELDISFSEECKREIPLLAGACIYKLINEEDILELGVMMTIAHERGGEPYQNELYELIMQKFENSRIEIRKFDEYTEMKISAAKKMTEEEKAEWSEGVNYITNIINEQIKYFKLMNMNIISLREQLDKKSEEANLLWWLIADWSELYGCGLNELEDKKAAVVVPLEVMQCVKFVPGPIAVRKIMQKALHEHKIENQYSVKEYIEAIGEEVLAVLERKEYERILHIGYTPIFKLIQDRCRFPKESDIQTVYKLFEEIYDTVFLDEKISVIDFAYQLYLEKELIELLQ